ncbi:MAG: SAM-dependent methyltransferase [Actinomycetia bacterium]|nr:SAM-dependent methyltransferase [Actinomycetes bacterium]
MTEIHLCQSYIVDKALHWPLSFHSLIWWGFITFQNLFGTKVLKSGKGVFATRSPHRPNHLGMSVVRLEKVEGSRIYVRDVDMLDGTPVIDIKPYVADLDCRQDK